MTPKQKFLSSIKRGTGEAHLLMKAHPEIDFSNEICKAARKNFAYDVQCEGSRAEYVWELILLSGQKEKIRKAILDGIETEIEDSWALDQLFDLAVLFTKQGDKKFHDAIYKRFYKKIMLGSVDLGKDQILEMDGLEGLKFIAETIGKALEADPEIYEDSATVDDFQQANPEIKVYEELDKAAEKNKFIKIYLEKIRIKREPIPASKKPEFNYETITEKIKNNERFYLGLRAAQVSEIDIKKLADDFLKEKNKLRQEKYLRIFDRVKFPYDYQPVFILAKGKYSSTNSLIENACDALRYFSGNDIREFALKKLSKSNCPDVYMNLLVSNYVEGDYKLLKSIAEKHSDPEMIHRLVYSFIRIYEANPTPECKEPLEAIYNKLTCGLHRTDILEILIQNNVLSEKIKEEIQFDSYEEVRALYKKE
jgi:hypothetical protein